MRVNPYQAGVVLLTFLGFLFFLFMGLAAFAPGLLASPVIAGGTVSLWFLYAIGLIWTSVLCTGLHVLIANAAEDKR
ncbi:DUF485 domain-containing protein [Methylobacterium sp. NEAU 140]|uniref:DUF485 domain-containing protein n=1 Tax=Methylobacterium sp. NEAU 140 TaxID=3064945 RepID=UPI0027327BBF|nr:DUF485 domain-containing protein [Methylobacterium sp. NEAU 140]MDP4026138.1 DUF485 domain-containing protein [Methylobacterium sp. NEAU 140]MDP4027132.1 DUF485 domain-containing protein [Methylobacterium sp. NEAU 140]